MMNSVALDEVINFYIPLLIRKGSNHRTDVICVRELTHGSLCLQTRFGKTGDQRSIVKIESFRFENLSHENKEEYVFCQREVFYFYFFLVSMLM